jgi:hypothetical protein
MPKVDQTFFAFAAKGGIFQTLLGFEVNRPFFGWA